MSDATASAAEGFLAWSDVGKALLGFLISLILLWAKGVIERRAQLRQVKRSAWNVAKNHITYKAQLESLKRFEEALQAGRAWISSVDISARYSELIADLARLDPRRAEVYIGLLGAEDVVREGYRRLDTFRTDFIRARTAVPCPADCAVSIRVALQAQIRSLREDLLTLAKREIEVLRLLQIKRSDALDPITLLQEEIAAMEEAKRISAAESLP
jgi:heme exporter protein D